MSEENKGYRLEPRDLAVFQAIHDCRALTTCQVGAKFYLRENGEPRNDVHNNTDVSPKCRARLKLLWQKGYLYRESLPKSGQGGRKPNIYFLDTGAADKLAEAAVVSQRTFNWQPKDNQLSHIYTLPHLVAINDVRISIEVDAQQRSVEISTWETEQELAARSLRVLIDYMGSMEMRQFIPDAYFCLHTNLASVDGVDWYDYAYFLEVDRDTEHAPLGDSENRPNNFPTKVVQYLTYFASQRQLGDFGTHAIRVLTVTTDEKRLEKLLEATVSRGGGKHFWFTTFADLVPVKSALTKPIWRQAGDRKLCSLIW